MDLFSHVGSWLFQCLARQLNPFKSRPFGFAAGEGLVLRVSSPPSPRRRSNSSDGRRVQKEMWFLCVFYHRLLDYRRPEVESLAELFGAFGGGGGEESSSTRALEWKLPDNHQMDSPFHFVSLPSEEFARNVANRSKAPAFILFPLCFFPPHGNR